MSYRRCDQVRAARRQPGPSRNRVREQMRRRLVPAVLAGAVAVWDAVPLPVTGAAAAWAVSAAVPVPAASGA
jgi:hypothetical protein